MALDDTSGLPNGKPLDGGDAPASADDAEILVAQAQGPAPDGVPAVEPGDPGPAFELNPEQLATLLVALSQGQNIDEAMNEMLTGGLERAGEMGATPQSIEAAINAFKATLIQIVGEGQNAEQAVISANDAFFKALQVAQEQQAGESQTALVNALATGENVDEVVGENTEAFQEALQAALESGASMGEALAAAQEAQNLQNQVDGELANATPGDALIAALASGENVDETVGALQGDGDPAAFEAALAAALDGGADLGQALAAANQAAQTAAQVAAEQAAGEANADPLLAALASGNNDSGVLGPDTTGMSPEAAAAANAAFQAALTAALEGGQSLDAAMAAASNASDAAATATDEATAGEQNSVLAQLASGNADGLGPDTTGMSQEAADAANAAFQEALTTSLGNGQSADEALANANDAGDAVGKATEEGRAGEQNSVLAQLASGNADNLGPDTTGMTPEQAQAAIEAFNQQLGDAINDGATIDQAANQAEAGSQIAANDATPDSGTTTGGTATETGTASTSDTTSPPTTSSTAATTSPPTTTTTSPPAETTPATTTDTGQGGTTEAASPASSTDGETTGSTDNDTGGTVDAGTTNAGNDTGSNTGGETTTVASNDTENTGNTDTGTTASPPPTTTTTTTSPPPTTTTTFSPPPPPPYVPVFSVSPPPSPPPVTTTTTSPPPPPPPPPSSPPPPPPPPAPSSTTITAQAATEDTAFSYSLTPHFSSSMGLTYTKVSGPSWLTVSGTNLTGTPSTNADAGTQTVTISASDSLGRSVQQTFTLTVTAVDDAPVITVTNATPLAYTENDAATVLDSLLTLSDEEDNDVTAVTITIGNRADGDTLEFDSALATTFGISETGTAVGTDGTLELTGTATPAQWEQLLRTVKYVSSSDDPGTATRTITFSVSDGTHTSTATRSVSVTVVNDAPVLSTNASGAQGFGRSGDAVNIDADLILTDPDAANYDGGTLTVTITSNNDADDRLSVFNNGTGAGQIGLSGSDITYAGTVIGTIDATQNGVGTNALSITFNDSATKAAVQALLRALSYDNENAGVDINADRVVTIVLQESDGVTSNTYTRTVDIVDNVAPTITGSPTFSTDEDTTFTFASTSFDSVFSDTNVGDTLQAIRIETLPSSSLGTLKLDGVAVTVGQQITRAQLADLTFEPAADVNDDLNGAVTFTFKVGDGKTFSSASQTATINIAAQDDAPRLTATGGRTYAVAGARAVVIDPLIVILDPDAANASTGTYADTGTGYLQAQISSGRIGGDVLSIKNIGTGSGEIGFDGTSITYEGTVIGTVDGTLNGVSSGTLKINLNSNASNDAVQALARAITIDVNDLDQGSAATKVVTFTASDGQNVSTATATRTVDLGDIFSDDFSTTNGTRAALSFDGVNDRVTMASNSVFHSGSSAMTMEGWINTSVNSSAIQTIFSLGSATATQTVINTSMSSTSGMTLSGNATVTGGELRLTSASNNQYGTAVIDPSGDAEGARNFTASFDLKMGESTTKLPADGFTFSYGNNTFSSAITGNGRDFENGVLDGLTIAFDTFDNGGSDTINGIDVILNGTVIHHANVTGGTRTSSSTHAATFDGNGDVLYRIGDGALDQSGNVTFEAWIKPDSYPTSGYATIVSFGGPNGDGDSAQNYSMLVELLPNGKIRIFHEYDTGTNQDVTFSPTIALDTWTHIAISRDTSGSGGNYKLYINGTFVGIEFYSNDPEDASDAYFSIGAEFYDTSSFYNYFDGQMDDVRVWDDVRTAAEISANYDKELTGSESGLVAYYSFDNSLTQDDSSNEGSQTLTNQNASRTAITDSKIEAEFVRVTITHDENGLTVTYDGLTEISNLDLGSNYAPNASDVFTLAARTGASNDLHAVDNLTITATSLGTRNAIAVKDGKLVFITEEHYGAETNGGETVYNSNTTVTGDWHYVAATHSGTTLRLYVDGALVQTITGVSKDILTGGANIGSADGSSDYFAGLINEIRLWNEARTASEISDDYLPELSNANDEATLVGYWKAADVSGSTITDSSNNSNNGTVSGATKTTTTTLFPGPNGTDWVVLDGTDSGTSNDIAYVDTDTGELVIQNRELVRTADQFDPSSSSPVHVTGSFKFTGNANDYFHLMTRADPSSTNDSGFPANGISFTIDNATNTIIIEKVVDGVVTTLTASGDSLISLSNNIEYSFDIYDDGTNLRLTVTEVGNSSNTATLTATDATDFDTNYVVVTNREDNGTASVVKIDNLTIDHDIVIDEGDTFTGTLPSTGLGSSLTFSVMDDPAHGTLTITDAATGAYTYTPASGYHGQDSFNIKVVDGDGNVNTQTVSFNVTADLDVLVAGNNLDFDGSNDYVRIDDSNSLDFASGQSFSLETWINLDDVNTLQSLIDKGSTSSVDSNYRFIVENGTLKFWTATSGSVVAPVATLSANTWIHVAVTYDADANLLQFYQNGDPIGDAISVTTLSGTNSDDLLIGRDVQGRYVNGQMDEVRIWSETRSADDIRLNYNQQVAADSSGLVAYYAFDDVQNGVVTDKTGNDNDGTLGAGDTVGDSAEPTIVEPTAAADMPDVYGSTLQVAENETAHGVMAHNEDISGTVSYAVVDGANLVTSFTTDKGGTVTINASTGAWSYEPAADYYGADSFTLRASGATSGTDDETVTITVAGGTDESSVGISDGALQLDGNGDYVNVSHDNALNFGTGAFTVEAWGRAVSNSQNSEMVTKLLDENNGTESGWALRYINGGTTAQFIIQYYNGSTLQVATVEYAVTEGEWYHLAGVREADGSISLYVNGALVDTDTGLGLVSVDNASRDLRIGADQRVSGGTEYMKGEVDDVRIWSDARTADEIALNYKNQLNGDENNLVAYYTFDDDNNGTTVDNRATATGSMLDGTLVGDAKLIDIPQNALRFDGTNVDGVQVAASGDLLIGDGSFTMEGWFNTTDTSLQTMMSLGANGSGVALRIDGGDINFNRSTSAVDNSADLTANTNVADGLWHHVSLTFDASTLRATLYLDGVAVATKILADGFGINAGNLNLGAGLGGGNDYTGDLANWRIWDNALSAEEVANTWNTTMSGTEDGLIVNYIMDSFTGKVLEDSAGDFDITDSGDATLVTSTPTIRGTDVSTGENQSVTGDMTANDVAGTPTYSVSVTGKTTSAADADGKVTVTTANGGTVSVDTVTGKWVYTPADNWYSQSSSDTDSFTLTATGDNGTTDSETITVNVANKAENSVVINDGVLHTPATNGSHGSAALGTGTLSNTITVEFKVNFSDTTDGVQSVLTLSESATKKFVTYLDSSGQLLLYFGNTGTSLATGMTMQPDVWYDIAFTYDGSTANMYLDGALVGTATNTGLSLSNSAQTLMVGSDIDGSAQLTNAQFDEVKVWSTVRGGDDILNGIDQPVASGTTGLQAYYRFDDQNTSGTVQDQSGNNRDMTINGDAEVINGLRGAVGMDGGDRITITSDASLNAAQGTWSLWVKTEGDWTNDGVGNTSNAAYLIGRADAAGSANGLFVALLPDGTLSFAARNGSGADQFAATSSVKLDDAAWHEITISYDTTAGGINKLYVDGVLVATAQSSGAWNFNNQDLLIGDSDHTAWSSFKGEIGTVEIYDRQLTDSEVADGYGNETDPATDGLVGFYDFTEGSGTTAYNDATGGTQSPDATVTGGTWLDLDNGTTATTLVIQEDETATGHLLTNDVPGDTFTFSVPTNGSNGTVTVNSDGTWTYVPRGNFHGTDTFTLRVSGTDANGTVYNDDETITVTVNSVADGNSVNVADGALSLDGTNDKVDLGSSGSIFTGTGSFTYEAWIKPTSTGSRGEFLSIGSGSGNGTATYFYVASDGTIQFDIQNEAGPKGTTVLTDGDWHQVTATYDASTKLLSIYVDGNLEASKTLTNAINVGSTGNAYIGNAADGSNRPYSGLVDEVRIWNDVRTATEIQDTYDQQVSGDEANLQAYYRFDGDTDGNVVQDLTGNGNDGTLTDGADIVSSTATVLGNEIEIQTSETAGGTFTTADLPTGATFSINETGANSSGGTSTFTTAKGGTVSLNESTGAWTYTPASGYYGDDSFTLRGTYTNNSQTMTDDETITVTVKSDNNVDLNGGVLSVDAADSVVNVGYAADLNITGDLTIEAWINPQGNTSNSSTGGVIAGKNNAYLLARLNDGSIRFALNGTNGTWSWIDTGYDAPAGEWTHLALTFDANESTVQLYANGELVATSTVAAIPDSIYSSTESFVIGGRSGADEEFNGLIDEVRVWNDLRSAAEIAENYDQKLTGSESNLVGYWQFDDVTGTTVNDSAGTNDSGTLAGNAKVVPNLSGALDFDGSTNFINAGRGASDSLAIAGDLTIETWLKLDALGSTYGIVDFALNDGDASAAGNVLYQIEVDANGDIVYAHEYNSGLNSTPITFDTNLVAGQWYHIAVTRDVGSNLIKIYVDGELIGSAQYTTSDPNGGASSTLIIGGTAAGSNLGDNKLNGQLSDLRIWNVTRSGEQIAANYDNVLSGDQDGTLVANWRFDEGSGSSAADSSGTQSSVSVTGSAHWVDAAPNVYGKAITIDENETLQGIFNSEGADGSATFTASASNGGSIVIDSATGKWTYIPAENYNGTETLTFTATGAQGTTDTETVTVTITADAAQVSPVSNSAAFRFDGSGDYIALPVDAVNNLASGTIEAWVYLDSITGETIFAKQHEGSNTYALLSIGYTQDGTGHYQDATDGKIYFQAVNGGGNLASTTTLETGQWYHLAVTFSGTEASLYVNGELDTVESGNFSIPDDTASGQSARIGDWSSESYGLDGMIDEFRVWSDVRTAEEIQANYDQQVASNADNLVGYWNADGATGTTVPDLTANDNDGTLNGDAAAVYVPQNALKFDGGDIVDTGTGIDSSLKIDGDITVETWVKPDSLGSTQSLFVLGGDNDAPTETAADAFLLGINLNADGTLTILHETSSGTNVTTVSDIALTAGEWAHISVVRDVSERTYTIYINGEVAGFGSYSAAQDVSSASAATNATLKLGSQILIADDSLTNSFTGQMADVRVWNTARTSEEVADNMNQALSGNQGGALVANYQFNETSGQTVVDSANDNDATLGSSDSAASDDPTHVDGLPAIHTNAVTVAENHSASGQMTSNDVVPTSATFGVSASDAVSTDTSLTIDGKGTVTIDSATGAWVFTPNANWNGTAQFYLSASGGGETDVEQFTVKVNPTNVTSNTITTSVAQFDGDGDHLDITLSGMQTGTGSFTMETWFNTSMTGTGIILENGPQNTNAAAILYIDAGVLSIAKPGTLLADSGSTTYNDGNWHHVSAVYDGDTDIMTLYVDGVVIDTATGVALNIVTDDITIGRYGAGANIDNPYQGMLADVRFWSDARTSAEIAAYKDQKLTGAEDNLEGYYTFDDHDGSTVTNSAKDGITLDGSDDYVSVSNVDLANKSFTIEMWSYRETSTADDYIIGMGPDSDGSNKSLHVGYQQGNIFTFAFYGDDLDYVDPTGDNVGEWVHWAVTYDATTNLQTIYKNGESVATRTATADFNPNVSTLEIGRAFQTNSSYNFDGSVDDVRVWNDVRTEAEIQASMNTTLSGDEDGLLVNLDFNQDGTTVTNQASTGATHNGTVNGGATASNTDATPSSYALSLDGTNQYLTATSDSTLLFTSSESFTLETWVTLDEVGASLQEFFDHAVADTNDYSNFRFGTINGNLYLYSKSASEGFYNTGTANGILQAGVPTHVAVSYDATSDTVTFYVNGQEVPVSYSNDNGTVSYGSNAWEPASDMSPTALYIGTDALAVANGTTNDRFVRGDMDDTRIWSDVRTADEIADNYTKTMSSSESGLVAQWTYDTAASLGTETTGNYTATPVNNPTATTMERPTAETPLIINSLSKAVSLDGTDDYVAVGDLGTTFGSMTVETWLKLDSLSSGLTTLLSSDETWSNGDMIVQIDGTTGKLTWTEKVNGIDTPTTLDYDFRELVGEWTHIALVKDADTGELRLSINGDVVAVQSLPTASWTSSLSLSDARIGYYTSLDAQALDGQIADFRIWSTARSADEVALNFDRPVTGNQGGDLIVRYDFDNVSGNTVTDTTSGNNGTLTGGATVVDSSPVHYGTTIVIAEDQAVNGTMTANDIVGTASYSTITAPTNGTLSIDSATGDWTYTPNANFSGTDSFKIQASDGTFTDAETITVTVQGDTDPNVSGKSFQFDGQDTTISASLGTNTITNAFTIEYWIQYDDTTQNINPLRISAPGGTNPRVVVTNPGGNTSLWIGDNASSNEYDSGFDTSANTWSHVAITWDGSTLSFYQNGVLTSTHSVSDIPIDIGEQTLFLGADVNNDGAANYDFSGLMDDVRIWNVARSGQQIADNYDKALTGDESGLVGYYTGDGVSGNTVQDQSSADHDATIKGGTSAPVVLPHLGDAMVFDGNNDRITVQASSDINITKGTWVVWFKTDGTWASTGNDADNQALLIGQHDPDNADDATKGMTVVIDQDTGQVRVFAKNTDHNTSIGSQYSNTTSVLDDQWHQVAVTFDQGTGSNGTISLYLDGALVASASSLSSWDFNNNPMFIGDTPDTYWDAFKGQIADVRVYDRILTADEISVGMTDGLPSNDSDLVLHLDMSDVDGTNLNDASDGGNTVTLTGSPTTVSTAPDIQGNAITVAKGGEVAGSMSGDDVSGTPGYTIATSPTHGTLVLNNETGDWRYTPNGSYVGEDSFSIQVTGSIGGTDTETIAVTVSPGEDNDPIPTQTAMQFDGVNDRVDLGALSENISGAFAFEAWIKIDSTMLTNNGWSRIIEMGNGAGSNNLLLGIDPGNDQLALDIYDGASATAVRGTYSLPTDEWIHVAAVSDGIDGTGTSYLYINGELIASAGNQQAANDVARTQSYIGQSNWPNETMFKGEIAEVRIWNTYRSAEEIQANYDHQLTGSESGLLAYYTFDEMDNGVLTDKTSNNNDAQIVTNTYDSKVTSGPTGNVLSLDGTDDHVTFADPGLANNSFTIEFWSNRETDTNGTGNTVFSAGPSTSVGLTMGWRGPGWPESQFYIGFNDENLTYDDGTTGVNEWIHWAATYDAETNLMTLYKNGTSVGTLTMTSDFSGTGTLYLGRNAANNSYFDGQIDNFRLWSDVRTAEEIREGMSQSYDLDTANLSVQYTFDDVDGTTVHDTAQSFSNSTRQNNNDGTLNGGATILDSGSGGGTALNFLDNAISFDGTGDVATGVTGLAPTGSDARTIMVWAKTSSDATQTLASYGSNTDQGAIRFTLNGWGAGQGISIDTNSGAITFQPLTGTDDGQWHHYALVVPQCGSLRDLQVYQDGVLLTTVTALWNNADTAISTGDTEAFKLGAWLSGDYFNGSMAEASVWSSALTAAQINQYMNEQLSGSETGLSAYWRGSDDGSGKVQDFTSGNHDLTLGGNASIVDVAPDISSTSMHIAEDTIATGRMTGDDVSGTASYAIVNGSNTVTSFTTANNGTVTIDPTTGVWNYVPNDSFSGTDTFTLRATGDNGTTDNESISVRVGHDPVAPQMYSMSFDGSDDYVTAAADDFVLTGTGDFTYEVWFKTDTTDTRMDMLVVGNADDSNTHGTAGYLYIDNNQLKFGSAYEFSSATTTSNVTDGAWHHAAVTYVGSSNSFTLYLDGQSVATGTMSTQVNITEGEVAIGAGVTTHGANFNGEIAEARIWDAARTATEIANNYDKQLSGDETNLQGYWTFSEGSGNVTTDQTGNGNDAAVIGGSYTDLTTVSLAASTSYKGLILGADADSNDTLSYSLKTQAEHGTVTLDNDGTYTYTGSTVDDSFEVTITDDNGNSTDHVIHFDIP